VRKDREGPSAAVEPDATSGDYLLGFLLGTRRALFEKDRESITITIEDVSPRSVGALIALYERAVGFYATLVDVNAYHQPGVEAGKKAAAAVLEIQSRVLAHLRGGGAGTADEIAAAIGAADEAETVFHVLDHLAANAGRGVARSGRASPGEARFRAA
jgi:glucose-6-phosphate isomerase